MVDASEKKQRFLAHCAREVIRNKFSASAHAEKGLAHLALDQFEDSIAAFDRAIRLDPDYEIAYKSRALAFDKLGRYQEAIADYSKTIELDPDYIEAYYSRGCAYGALKLCREGIADFDRVLQVKPTNFHAYVWRAFLYEKLKDYQKEIADCTAAIELKPDYAIAYNNRGFAYGKLKQYDRALQDLGRAIELDNHCRLAYTNRALIFKELGWRARSEAEKDYLELAVRDLTVLISKFHDSNRAWLYGVRAGCYLRSGNFAKTLNDTSKVLEQSTMVDCSDEFRAWVLALRVRARLDLGEPGAIVSECSAYIERDHLTVAALVGRANAYEELDLQDKAFEDYGNALAREPKNQAALFGKARTNFKVNFEKMLFGDSKDQAESTD